MRWPKAAPFKGASGKIRRRCRQLVGGSRTNIQGNLDQTSGAAQDLYGQAADAARETASGFDKWLRTTIETQPYAAAAAALGTAGFGRMHRPLAEETEGVAAADEIRRSVPTIFRRE